MGNLLLPVHANLAEDLGGWGELVATLEEDGTDYNGVGSHNFLVVVLFEELVENVAIDRG